MSRSVPDPLAPSMPTAAAAGFDALGPALGGRAPLRWLGHTASGEWCCLARETDGRLAVLAFPAGWEGALPAPEPRVSHVGSTELPLPAPDGLAADDPSTGGLGRDQLMEAVRGAASEAYDIIGDLPRATDGALAYVAASRADGAWYALSLQREGDEVVLAAVPVPLAEGPLIGAASPPPAAAPRTGNTPPRASGAAAQPGTRKVCPQCENDYDADVRFCPLDGATLVAAAPNDDLVGQVVADRYHVEKLLGEGGMGRVYLAEHVRMGRRSAVKVMGRALVNDREALSRFNREAANAARITHTHVAAIYDFGETHDGLVYLAMEYVEGVPLTALIEEHTALPPGRAAVIVAQTADGLDAAHALGIVHRDLKPDNIMVTRARDGGDCVKIVDFGIAKDARAGASQQVTRTGMVIGTPEYMSPEQLTAEALDGRSDVYSLALVAFVLFTGQLPFESTTTEQLLMARLVGKPRTLAEVRPDVQWPEALQAVFDRALARDPAARFASAGEFGATMLGVVRDWTGLPTSGRVTPLAGTLVGIPMVPRTLVADAKERNAGSASSPTTVSPSTTASPTRSRTPMLAAAAVLVLVVGGGAYALLGGGDGGATDAPVAAADAAGSAGDTMLLSADAQTGAPTPATPAVDATLRADLEQIGHWVDIASGDESTARRALAAIPALEARISTARDSVELDYYRATAYGMTGDMTAACRELVALAPRAKRVGYFEESVNVAVTGLGCA